MRAFGTPKKAPPPTIKLEDYMLEGYCDDDSWGSCNVEEQDWDVRFPDKGFNFYKSIKAGYRPVGTNVSITDLKLADFVNFTVTDISPLAKCLPLTRINNLNLSNNTISDISDLARALPSTCITHLDLSYNEIIDISDLVRALPSTQITALNLEGNAISDISDLARVLPSTQITALNLEGNAISDISDLARVLPSTQITDLDLEDNEIIDITHLTNVICETKICSLGIGCNNIKSRDVLDFIFVINESLLRNLNLWPEEFFNEDNTDATEDHPVIERLEFYTIEREYGKTGYASDINKEGEAIEITLL
jgi:Leucine-rich repeat (LRR) protein